MFAKLLKHEWKATSGLLGFLSLAALGIGILLTVLLRFILAVPEDVPEYMMQLMMTILVGGFMGIMAYMVGTQIILLIRFYKNKFSDEGYLTFTLPVSTHHILLSSLLNYLIWTVISMVVVLVVFAIVTLVGTTQTGIVNKEITESILRIFETLASMKEVGGYVALLLCSTIVSSLGTVVLIHTAITLGAVLAKKHKILAAVGFYYGFSVILGMISSCLMVFVTFAAMSYGSVEGAFAGMNMALILQMGIYAAVAVAGYFVSHYFMKNKLNLP